MDVEAVIRRFPSFRKTYSNWWRMYLMKAGILPSPQLLSIRGEPYQFYIPKDDIWIGRHIFYNGEYGFIDFDDFDVVVDAGAHVGTFTVPAAGAGCVVHSYEPYPDYFSLLERNISINPVPEEKIKTYKEAVSGDDEVTITVDPGEVCPSPHWDTDSEPETVDAVDLSRLVDRIDSPEGKNLLKLDVEGSEYSIINNTDVSTLQYFDTIICEWHSWGGDPQQLLTKIEEMELEIELIDDLESENGVIKIET